ncbi:hypothetical protein [Bacillus infantis]|uniref:hypothetical protein n=1 Tax=Bacillus infantis TaxID=324767 RepID=UPI003CF2B381
MNKEALEYLKGKYGKDFVISNVDINKSSGLYRFDVNLKNQPGPSSTVFVYKNEMEFRDSYLKVLIEDEFQRRDKPILENLFQKKFHSFYGGLIFFDEILSEKENISINKLLSIDPNLEHEYKIYLEGKYSPTVDKEKILDFITYLKEEVKVKKAEINIAYFNKTPDKRAENAFHYYKVSEDVNLVITITPDLFQAINNVEDFDKNFTLEGE